VISRFSSQVVQVQHANKGSIW